MIEYQVIDHLIFDQNICCVYCELPVSFSWGGMMWILVVVEGILSMCYQ